MSVMFYFLIGALLAANATAEFIAVPFPTTVRIHPEGKPDYSLTWQQTGGGNGEPITYKLRM